MGVEQNCNDVTYACILPLDKTHRSVRKMPFCSHGVYWFMTAHISLTWVHCRSSLTHWIRPQYRFWCWVPEINRINQGLKIKHILIKLFFSSKDLLATELQMKTFSLYLIHVWLYSAIIPAPHQYAYFAQSQFDWLEQKCYTSINFMSRNHGTIFLPPAPKIYNNVDKYDFDDKVGIIRNELLFLMILSLCKLRRISHKLYIKPLLSLWVIRRSLQIDKIHKNKKVCEAGLEFGVRFIPCKKCC